MSITTKKKGVKKNRIRPELLPDSAKYATIDEREYIMIPVSDFGEWYNDVLDGAIADERRAAGADTEPFDQVVARLGVAGRKRK